METKSIKILLLLMLLAFTANAQTVVDFKDIKINNKSISRDTLNGWPKYKILKTWYDDEFEADYEVRDYDSIQVSIVSYKSTKNKYVLYYDILSSRHTLNIKNEKIRIGNKINQPGEIMSVIKSNYLNYINKDPKKEDIEVDIAIKLKYWNNYLRNDSYGSIIFKIEKDVLNSISVVLMTEEDGD